MKTISKLEQYFELIMGIQYHNQNGGSYAYLQFLAYTRELLKLIRPIKSAEKHAEAIEGINWLLNEYLAVKFSPRNEVIFETKKREFEEIFSKIRFSVREMNGIRMGTEKMLHAQAA